MQINLWVRSGEAIGLGIAEGVVHPSPVVRFWTRIRFRLFLLRLDALHAVDRLLEEWTSIRRYLG